MTRSAADLIDDYVSRLTAELAAVGAAEADDLAAEVRSMLTDASGDDSERAAAEISALGDPAELAAGILAERGLTPEGGMSPAEWWRMGIAVPIDIAVGVSVPIAAAVLLFLAYSTDPRLASPAVIAFAALLLASLAWPWYLWRPWRAGGMRLTPGMAIMGITVVRAPGFWRVVRSEDLAALGLATPRRSRLLAATPVLLALALVVWALVAVGQFGSGGTLVIRADQLAGAEATQRTAVRVVAEQLYAAVGSRDQVAAGSLVTGEATDLASGLPALMSRAVSDPPVSSAVTGASMVSPGIWTATVAVKGQSGTTYTDTLTVNLSLVADEHGFITRWVVTAINAAGCASGS